MQTSLTSVSLAALSTLLSGAAASGAVVSFGGTGANPGAIAPFIDNFRSAVGGPVNAPGAGPFVSGRREINWDAPALDAFASPALMPNNFFNNNSKRGAAFTTPGDGFLVSQRGTAAGFTNSRFGEIDPSYTSEFQTFSAERLFAAKNSTVTDVFFFVPTSPATPATVDAFGAVFTDVDNDSATFLQFFDVGGTLMHTVFASPLDKGLSFAGARFDAGERIARVRITSGNAALGAGVIDAGSTDLVAMDDFIYSEPLEVPAPGAAGGLLGLATLALRRRR